MTDANEALCTCDTCPGSVCNCGCQETVAETACACSELCACGIGCDCAGCSGGSQ